ncbi:riboflavin kinase [Ammoniphilus resinae]|uniref:riboflavin kinase n=1 Tax=Ammoniphilus resinae TaxID=861532 RepID=A0ABS4GSL8_9BACL|nr:riboflavin kinase [Ammoniphilus resinae]MBP1933287.1 riboflavin kinase/FMN adenylyltransferase [Ammoniphilus resinae]
MDKPICVLIGLVVRGKKIGRKLGFPTANLSILSPDPHLKHGVYGVRVNIDGVEYCGVLNVGVRPSFRDGLEVSYEVFIINFNNDIYNKKINVEVCFYIRPELSFPNSGELIDQIKKDVNFAKRYFDL